MNVNTLKNENGQNNKQSILLSWLFPIYYILAQYELPIFTIGTWLLLILVLESIMTKYIVVHKYILLFFFYTFFVEVLLHRSSISLNGTLNMIFAIVFVAMFGYKINLDKFYRSYKVIGIVVSIFIIIQFILMFILNQNIKSSISIFPPLTSGIFEWERRIKRPSSLFSEPQAYASYIIPLILLSIKQKDYKLSIFLTFCILLSTSSQGIISIGVIWLIYANKFMKGTLKKLVLNGSIFVSGILFFTLPWFNFAREKILNTDFSDNVRLTRGFETYSVLPIFNKLFGIGFLNQEDFFKNSDIILEWYNGSVIKEFITSAAGIIVYFGFFAGIIMLVFLIQYYRYSKDIGKMLCILLILSMLSQNILYNSWFIFYYILLFNMDDFYNKKQLLKIKLF